MTEIIKPFVFWLNNPNYQAQIAFIKESNPGMTVDVSDLVSAILIPVCKTCRTDVGLCFHSWPIDEATPRHFYKCSVCGNQGAMKPTKEEAIKEWFDRNVVPTN